jgi:hypothetical protein
VYVSDFDDEPTEGAEATDDAGAVPAATRTKRSEPRPVPDDDWDDDWDDEDDERGPKRDLTLVYAIVAAAIVIVLAVVLTRPKDDNGTTNGNEGAAATTTAVAAPVKNWQGPVGDAVGKDGADAQKRAEGGEGVYIWTDFGGWHLRNNNTQEVTVTVSADKVRQKSGDGKGDDAPFATELTVKLPAGDGAEGVEIDLGDSENATFVVKAGGKDVPADQIFLGGAEGVADANPVTFVKS